MEVEIQLHVRSNINSTSSRYCYTSDVSSGDSLRKFYGPLQPRKAAPSNLVHVDQPLSL